MSVAITRRAAAALLSLVPFARIARAEEEPKDGTHVRIDNFTFSPAELRIKAGETVTWTNEDDIPHTVVSRDLAFRSKPLDTGDGFSMRFEKPGRVDYFCSLHPHMVGAIVVEG